MNLVSFAFVDTSMLMATMMLKYGRNFVRKNDQELPRHLTENCENIVLRGPSDHDWSADADQADYPLLGQWPSAQKLLGNVKRQIEKHLAAENLQFGQIALRALMPGGFIGWHIDDSHYAERHARFALLVAPCAGGCWYSGGEILAPGVGNLTYVNHLELNSAVNLGPVPQIALVADVRKPMLQ